jgi:hypothetical protein
MSIVSERWMNGVIEIIDPNLKDLSWDEWTNTMVGSEVLLWSGAARIQPVSNISSEINAGRSVLSTRRVRFQVPLDQTRDFVRAGLVVRVTDGGEFSDLEKLQFNVSSAVSSSYAWLLTIECEADVKSELDAGGS